jgi:hypothetical protein
MGWMPICLAMGNTTGISTTAAGSPSRTMPNAMTMTDTASRKSHGVACRSGSSSPSRAGTPSMGPADVDGGADEAEPGQRVLADLLHPEEADGGQVEPRGDPGHDVAEENAGQHVDHRDEHQRGDDDVGRPHHRAAEDSHARGS